MCIFYGAIEYTHIQLWVYMCICVHVYILRPVYMRIHVYTSEYVYVCMCIYSMAPIPALQKATNCA